ncbi:phosphotransferase family protein [Nesterenkonia ebinurensis]|uniref:phosphotransferase family protein n=1 Tax=Nesterenkonia ebinurensis TaxID=2608252 RepID=UPI00123D012B|nr:phosphotransferase [Nesterenkonia ebinurensis]
MSSNPIAKAIPSSVVDACGQHIGDVIKIETLSGLSGRTVAAVFGTDGSLVVKGPAPAAEVEVMRRFPEQFQQYGIRTPGTLTIVELKSSETWILMEHLPDPLPRNRWGADPEVLAVLGNLHGFPAELIKDIPERYQPRWDNTMTAQAATALSLDGPTTLHLETIADQAGQLFEPDCVISGDPNPLNWRLDPDGLPVLLDLERLTVANPAIDLTIMIPGFPHREDLSAMLRAYPGQNPPTVDEVLMAKAWSVVELAAMSTEKLAVQSVVSQLRSPFLSWIDAL